MQKLRREFQKKVQAIAPRKLVFVDESGASTGMTRTHGRAPRGKRVVDRVPQENWKVVTLLGAVRLGGMVAATSIEAPTDTAIFRCFVQEALIPQLHAGDVVLWDRLPAHRAADLEAALRKAGASLLSLPPYSPDFSPIEPGWSKVKDHLRSAKPRTPVAVGQAAAEAFASITAQDAEGWFRHCGYGVH